MSVWKAIGYVTSPLTLVAFLAALVAWVYITQLRRIEKLISTAPEKDRKVLVQGALDVFQVSVDKLPSIKQFQLALELIQSRRMKLRLIFIGFSIVAAALVILSVAAFYLQRPQTSLPVLLEPEKKAETLRLLKDYNIYSADDRDLPQALGNLITPKKEEEKLGIMERTRLLQQKIANVPSITDLRQRAEKYEPPFQPLGMLADVGVPHQTSERPRRFYVNVPIGAEYSYKRLLLVNPVNGDLKLRLIARPAIENAARDVDLQLNGAQAEYIFGEKLATSTAKLLVFVLGQGELFDPTCPPRGAEKECAQVANPESRSLADLLHGQ